MAQSYEEQREALLKRQALLKGQLKNKKKELESVDRRIKDLDMRTMQKVLSSKDLSFADAINLVKNQESPIQSTPSQPTEGWEQN